MTDLELLDKFCETCLDSPGNFYYWQSYAKNIAARAFPFRGMGFVYINDRKAGKEWTEAKKVWARQILHSIELNATRLILEKWLREGRIGNNILLQRYLSGQPC